MTKQGCPDQASFGNQRKISKVCARRQARAFWALALNFHQAVGLGKIVFPLVRPLEKIEFSALVGYPL